MYYGNKEGTDLRDNTSDNADSLFEEDMDDMNEEIDYTEVNDRML